MVILVSGNYAITSPLAHVIDCLFFFTCLFVFFFMTPILLSSFLSNIDQIYHEESKNEGRKEKKKVSGKLELRANKRKIFVVCGAPGIKFFNPIILLEGHSLSIFPLDVIFRYKFLSCCLCSTLQHIWSPS
jgi:hypothetical protein